MKKITFILILIASLNLHAITSKGAINIEKDENFKEFIKKTEQENPTFSYKKLSSKEKEAMRYQYGFYMLTKDTEKARALTQADREHLSKKVSEAFWCLLTSKKFREIPEINEIFDDEFIKELNLKDPNVKQMLRTLITVMVDSFFKKIDKEAENY